MSDPHGDVVPDGAAPALEPSARDAERNALLALAETRPAVLSALAPLRAKVPEPRTLTATARLSPRSEADLSALQAAQLVEAGRAWDRQTLPASRRLSCDENDEAALGAVLEHITIAEHGKPAFEAWLYQGDSGTFFTAGTTEVVAHRIQGGIQLAGKKKDPALVDALGRFSESKSASAPSDLADGQSARRFALAPSSTIAPFASSSELRARSDEAIVAPSCTKSAPSLDCASPRSVASGRVASVSGRSLADTSTVGPRRVFGRLTARPASVRAREARSRTQVGP